MEAISSLRVKLITENGWKIKSVALYGMYDEGIPYTG